ncbi:hydroxymethylbilane synthase [Parvularcula sp. LCG005]|uniref:hydroxymethylbilane synthase n=1 Tax=Parvularcula sp. LCG005 TaxID=3078805 RepID=UPI002941FAF5|nr:hydroxymethylbilane synthase [Parvularcula sp. LCG005]WOI53506.1 hydroxymethylbilane synthase [Parvularcula sp. LCG005]
MSDKPLRIASRRSPLAQAQARMVRTLLAKAAGVAADDAEGRFPILTYVTSGDQNLTPDLAAIGGKGLFTKEVEAALLSGEADIAVHSMKDMPAVMPKGLVLAATPAREDPRDSFVTVEGQTLNEMPERAVIGTSSVRRAAQLKRLRPDVSIVPMRGNVQTRLRKLADGDAQGTFLAEAGLRRLDASDVRRMPLDPAVMLPALGQGTLCVQARLDDTAALASCRQINCLETALASAAERAVTQRLEGSCRTPIAGLATVTDRTLMLKTELFSLDGEERFQAAATALMTGNERQDLLRASQAGEDVAAQLIVQAGPLLQSLLSA